MGRGARFRWTLALVLLPALAAAGIVAATPIAGTLAATSELTTMGSFRVHALGPESAVATWTPSAPAGFVGALPIAEIVNRPATLVVRDVGWRTDEGLATPRKVPHALFQEFRQYHIVNATVRLFSAATEARWIVTPTHEGALDLAAMEAVCTVVPAPATEVSLMEAGQAPVSTSAWVPYAKEILLSTCESPALRLSGAFRLVAFGSRVDVGDNEAVAGRLRNLSIRTGYWEETEGGGGSTRHRLVEAILAISEGTSSVTLPGGLGIRFQVPTATVSGALQVSQGGARVRLADELVEASSAIRPSGTFALSSDHGSIVFRGDGSMLLPKLAWGASVLAASALLWKFGFPPLQAFFTRVTEDAVLRQTRRRTILAAVASNEGYTTTAIAKLLGYPRRSVSYHARILAARGLIHERRFGRRVALFATQRPGIRESQLFLLGHSSVRAVLDALGAAKSLSQRELMEQVDLSQSRISAILSSLGRSDLVEADQSRRPVRYRRRRSESS